MNSESILLKEIKETKNEMKVLSIYYQNREKVRASF